MKFNCYGYLTLNSCDFWYSAHESLNEINNYTKL